MHVMQIIDSMHGGGAETSLLDISSSLGDRGVKVSLVTIRSDDGGLAERLNALGLTRISLEHRDPLRAVAELRKLMSITRPDLIHSTLFLANIMGRLAARTVSVPVITTLANQDYGPEHRSNSRYGAWSVCGVQAVNLITTPLTTRFHAISHDVARVMGRRLHIPKDRIQVIYRGRDTARLGSYTTARRLQTRAALSINAETPVILSASRLDAQKGVDTTIDAFRRLLNHIPDALLLIAGRPGNAAAAVEARARGCRSIRLLGHRTDVPDLMCAADVLAFPSRWEGLGGALIEAMALRLPMVTSNISPLNETIGSLGWPQVRPDDDIALADLLIAMLTQRVGHERRKDAGEDRFRALFTADAAADGMTRLYNDVLRSSGRHR